MITRSLYTKFTLLLFLLFSVIGVLFIGLTVLTTDYHQQEVLEKLNRDIASHISQEKSLIQNQQINQKALEEIFHMLMVINPSIEIYLLNPQGKILAYSAPAGKVKRNTVDLAPIQATLSHQPRRFPLLGDDPRNLHKKKVFSAAAIKRQGKLEGYIYVIVGGEVYDNIVQKLHSSYILQLSVVLGIGGILFALIAALFIFNTLIKRIKSLSTAMEMFKRDGTVPALDTLTPMNDSKNRDELDYLHHNFVAMAATIKQQLEALKQVDLLRRELIANVSHDLRTPLATLQGYLETLSIKEHQLSREQKEEYLQIAVKHCQRLNKLVAELFELAKLDAHETQVKQEPFFFPDLIQDVLQKFQLEARKRNIALVVNMTGNIAYVAADIGLIERVIENLLENALRFTPAGGTVQIHLAPLAETIQVEVSDTGPGIHPEVLPHIFDRFFTTHNMTAATVNHGGLGLAIAKRILVLHRKDISVDSTPGQGTTFRFQLPAIAPIPVHNT